MLYGAFLVVQGKACVVVGGGRVATRKVRKLLAAGAIVHVISPAVTDELAQLVSRNQVHYCARSFAAGDSVGAFLTFAATNDRTVNEQIALEVGARGGLVNVVDNPRLCTFMVPAVWSSAALQVAISSGGADPRVTKRLAQLLADDIAEDGQDGQFVAEIRRFIAAGPKSPNP